MSQRSASIAPVAVVAAVTAVIALLGSLVIGYAAVRSPELLHVDLSLSLESVAILFASIGLCALVLAVRPLALVLLLAFVYLNLSQVLVRFHDLPSLLQILLIPLLLAAWSGRGGFERRQLFGQSLSWLLLAYLLVQLMSTTLARDLKVADERVVEMTKTFVLYLLVPLLVSTIPLLRASLWTLLAAGGLLGALGTWQVLRDDFSSEMGGLARIKLAQIHGDVFEPRIAGPLGDPNFFAQILLVLVPLALWLAWGETRLSRKVAALALGALALSGTVLSYSRGAAMVTAVVLLLAFLMRGIRARTVLTAVALGSLILVALPADFRARLSTIREVLPGDHETLRPDSSFQKRALFMKVAWQIFLRHPVFGVGAGNYGAHFDENAEAVGSVARDYVDPDERHYPHNLYLEIAAETGLVGLTLFGAATVCAFLYLERARRAFQSRGELVAAGYANGFALALLGYLLSSLFLHGHFARYLWLYLGFAAALECISRGPVAAAKADSASAATEVPA